MAQTVNSPAVWATWVQSLGWVDPHGQRSLAGYSPQGHKESDMTEQLTFKKHLKWVHFLICQLYPNKDFKFKKRGFPGGPVVKNPPANAGDLDSIPGSGRSPGEGNGNPFKYSPLGNPLHRGPVHGVTKESDRT